MARVRRILLVLVVLLCVLAVHQDVLACPTCKESLASNDPHHANMVRGYFWSILFMMSMPFLILGGLGSYMYLLVRRARLQAVVATTSAGPSEVAPDASRLVAQWPQLQ